MVMKYPNRFISKKLAENTPMKIAKGTNFQDSDTGIFYKWDGKKFVQMPLSDHEKFALEIDDLKKDILKTRFGRFMLWTLDRLSQMMNWWSKKWQKK